MPQISITEVGLRDGLQNEPVFFPTEKKIALANRLIATGIRRLEATSFVSPKAVPQLSDAEVLLAELERPEDLIIEALVPNARGGERAASAGADVWVAFMSASQTHSEANSNTSVEQAFDRIRPLPELAAQAGASVTGALAVAFDCPFEGQTPIDQVVEIAKWFEGIGVTCLKLGDTIGSVSPARVTQVVEALSREVPELEIVLHFHNTRGMGLANVLAGIQCGVQRYEASLGGLGGCPFAPGASGNISTEDLVHMLHLDGFETGIDLDALIATGRQFAEDLGKPLPAHLQHAAPSGTRHTLDDAMRAVG